MPQSGGTAKHLGRREEEDEKLCLCPVEMAFSSRNNQQVCYLCFICLYRGIIQGSPCTGFSAGNLECAISIGCLVIGIAIVILFSGCAPIDDKSDTEKEKVSSKQTGTQQNSSNTENQNKNEKPDHTLKNTNTKESSRAIPPM
ncbi:hypothetical protein [Aneurinibacillus migulanus]|uniref:Uncharacterized protein n=1 Tax=Aneurinibacillus migulanus TaxID=47500 RepID=A0A0D1XVJ4_ANEMI|nr:hypothetical protein [Aneurinibacillus migulanus]KIV58171.1 hypothetical protein TS65_07590 [Aneurinibacillus migulanus]KON96956.1 hypothetical protein AF333_17190 [Aneurinibacillus migulanus]MED0896241.1 hypothetical protein [Aneurinibacillus migulanus]MED1618089.1 hypothetical protein [Aneurinibacillus migulanus]SDJ60584.1 hypothetical protein SAMN04487909_12221 [Aneurinibacillus migulanus]